MSRAALSGLFLVTFLTACGGRRDPEETTPELAYPTEQSFCEAVAEVECNSTVVKVCYGSDTGTLAADTESCEAARVSRCNPDALPYHPEEAEACVDARKAALADAVWTRSELDNVFDKCLPVLSKVGPDGGVCGSDHDCDATSGLRCIIKLGDLQGVCAEPVTVGGGESCKDKATICDETFFCDVGGYCLVKPTEGEACAAGRPCAADFYCTSPDEGVCLPKYKNGADCDSDTVCSGGFCIGAGAGTPGVCSATLPLTITSNTCDIYRE